MTAQENWSLAKTKLVQEKPLFETWLSAVCYASIEGDKFTLGFIPEHRFFAESLRKYYSEIADVISEVRGEKVTLSVVLTEEVNMPRWTKERPESPRNPNPMSKNQAMTEEQKQIRVNAVATVAAGLLASGHYTGNILRENGWEPEPTSRDHGKKWKEEGFRRRKDFLAVHDAMRIVGQIEEEVDRKAQYSNP